jgi:thiol-disulfide isomerase/thioredoxin
MSVTRRCVLASLAGAAAALAGCAERAQDLRPRWSALPAYDLMGRPALVAATAAGVRLINFWALWCPPCRHELPSLERLARVVAPQGIEVSAVAIASDPFAIREYLWRHTPALTSLVLPPGSAEHLALGLNVLPQTFLVAPDSYLIGRWTGAREWDAPLVVSELQRLARNR